MSSLPSILKVLQIPEDYSHYDTLDDTTQLEKWKSVTPAALTQLQAYLSSHPADSLTLEDQAQIISSVVPFAPSSDAFQWGWASTQTQAQAQSILSSPSFTPPSTQLLSHILTVIVKPVFMSNPHPRLNLSTGRTLSRPAGGPMASQDYYEEQTWKAVPGAGSLVRWCVANIEEQVYESIWHLVIPPVMTLLDDYEAKYKLQGVLIVSSMLDHVPTQLLKRTGIDGLLKTSLTNALAHHTPALLKHAIPASLKLTIHTTTLGSSARFDQLCALLGEGIITSIWVYAEDKPDVVLASLEALPELIEALDIGCVRFLKALIPQLTHSLHPLPPLLSQPLNSPLQKASIKALNALITVCTPRMKGWKATVLDAVGRCWVGIVDRRRARGKDIIFTTKPDKNKGQIGQPQSTLDEDPARAAPQAELAEETNEEEEIVSLLQETCRILAEACPSVVSDEYQRFFKADPDIFRGLFSRVPLVSASA